MTKARPLRARHSPPGHSSLRSAPILVLALLGLNACAPLEGRGQPLAPSFVSLEPGETLGQTFFSKHAGLKGIQVYLAPLTDGTGTAVLSLRSGPDSPSDLATASLPVTSVVAPGFYSFVFEAQPHSSRADYYLSLHINGQGDLQVGSAGGETYIDGALYTNGAPEDAQLAFHPLYDPGQLVGGLVREAIGWLGPLAVAAFLFLVPGLALTLLLVRPSHSLYWPEWVGIAAAVSLALYPLLFLWTDLLNLHLGSLYAWIPALAGLAYLAWRLRNLLPGGGHQPLQLGRHLRALHLPAADIAYIAVAALVFLVRFYTVRSLDFPLWGDSVQHTEIAQLLVDNGGLFRSWAPYADIATFTYHFGFHAAVAVFHWITGMVMPQATLWGGQILNGLAALALYPLAVRISSNRWAGVGAVLLAGLLLPMPMYYVNWGRYTQLAGQVILPVAIWMVLELLDRKRLAWGPVLLCCLLWGGLALTHYRVLIFAVLVWPACFVLWLRRGSIRRVIGSFALLGVGAGLLFLPWFLRMFSGSIPASLATHVNTPASQISEFTLQYNAIGDLLTYMPGWAWVLGAVAIGVGLWRRPKEVLLLVLWWGTMLLAANPRWVGLPGDGALSNFAVFIALYVPAALLIGSLPVWLGESLLHLAPRTRAAVPTSARWERVNLSAIVVSVVALSILGVFARADDLNETAHALMTRPDLRAMQWVRSQTPQSARFLVNSFPAYDNTLIVGSDAGWWLPLVGYRSTTLPPINYAMEAGPRADYRTWVNALGAAAQTLRFEDPTLQRMLEERGITYVFIGQRDGVVNSSGTHLVAASIAAAPGWHLVFRQDRVWIFGHASAEPSTTP